MLQTSPARGLSSDRDGCYCKVPSHPDRRISGPLRRTGPRLHTSQRALGHRSALARGTLTLWHTTVPWQAQEPEPQPQRFWGCELCLEGPQRQQKWRLQNELATSVEIPKALLVHAFHELFLGSFFAIQDDAGQVRERHGHDQTELKMANAAEVMEKLAGGGAGPGSIDCPCHFPLFQREASHARSWTQGNEVHPGTTLTSSQPWHRCPLLRRSWI